MTNCLTFLWGIWLLGLPLMGLPQADSSHLSVWRVGGSLTYVWNNGNPGLHQEYTLNLNFAYQPHPRWAIGAAGLNIWSKGIAEQWEHYLLVGAFGQFNLVNTPRVRLYPELGIYRGNYCTCGQNDPYRIPFQWYRSTGASMSIRLVPTLYLELGFYGHKILGELPGKYGYTQYIIGLEWQI